MKSLRLFFFALLPAFVSICAHAADSYPAKPIRMVVPLAAGGPADAVARVVASDLSKTLGQPVVIENRPGAGGTTGVTSVARADADGYSLLVVGPGPIVISPYIAETRYDPLKNLIPITQIVDSPVAIVASPKFRPDTFADLINYAKANPGKVTFGSPGAGTSNHLMAELIKKNAGIDMVHVPYRGGAPAVMGLLSGDVDIIVVDVSVVLAQIKAGEAKVIGLLDANRGAAYPGYPVVAESGYPGIVASNWYGLFVTGGTPTPIVARLQAGAQEALRSEAVRKQLADLGLPVAGTSSERFGQFLRDEVSRWGSLAKEAGVKLQ